MFLPLLFVLFLFACPLAAIVWAFFALYGWARKYLRKRRGAKFMAWAKKAGPLPTTILATSSFGLRDYDHCIKCGLLVVSHKTIGCK